MPLQTENLAAESIGAIGLRLTFRGLIYNELANEVWPFFEPLERAAQDIFQKECTSAGSVGDDSGLSFQIRREKASTVVVTSLCLSQPWFPSLLGLFCDVPRIIHPIEDLLVSAQREQNPLCEVAVVQQFCYNSRQLPSRRMDVILGRFNLNFNFLPPSHYSKTILLVFINLLHGP